MIKTFRYRLYPTKSQRSVLGQWLGACRWVYNKTLEARKEAWEEREENLRFYDTTRLLTAWKEEEPWLREVHSQVLQNAQHRVDLAFQAFFRRVKSGDVPGYPRFKNRCRLHSFCFTQYPGGCELEGSVLQIRKIGTIRLNLHRPVLGRIKTTTIKVTPTGKWFVSFTSEVEAEPLPRSKKILALDLGLEHFATAQNGKVVPNPRFFRADSKDLARAQRKLSRLGVLKRGKRAGPKRRRRRHTVALIHERIKNRRSNFAHKLSHALVARYGTIILEDLSIAKMLKTGKGTGLSLSISDVAWNRFVAFVAYKAEEAGRQLVLIDPAYTSQTCSRCGSRAKKDLSQRWHSCKICGLELDRDHNAALNILRLGLQSLASQPRSPRLLSRGE